MEQNKAERLNENVTEKMCSSDGNVVGEMCSPADADTCRDGSLDVKEREINARKWRISGIFVRLVSSGKPCGKLGFIIWKHIYGKMCVRL